MKCYKLGNFLLVQNFAELLPNPPEEIIIVLIFVSSRTLVVIILSAYTAELDVSSDYTLYLSPLKLLLDQTLCRYRG